MCRYLDNDMVLGNLFIKVIEKEMKEITFNKIYDFIYYASMKLNEEDNTTILVSKDGIMHFAELYRDFIELDADEERITIRSASESESLMCFRRRYEDNGREFAEVFDFAMSQIDAA